MRMSAKAEYATRAMLELAVLEDGQLARMDDIASAQGIPQTFLVDILGALRSSGLIRSHRGREGGYQLARPATAITLADVLRSIDGPLASVRDVGLGELPYHGATARMTDVWMALRASMRHVLEETTLAHVVADALPEHVVDLAASYRQQQAHRYPSSAQHADAGNAGA
jgi:Rrf2 family protein